MSPTGETALEMAIRHVEEGEARCARQRALIERMTAAGQDITEAERLLGSFDNLLSLSREHQQRLVQECQNKR